MINDGTFGTINSAALTIRTNATTAMTVDTSQRLLIGTTSSKVASGNFHANLQVEGTSANAAIRVTRNTNTGDPGYIILSKSRGTSVGSNTIVQDGDHLGRIRFAGADGTDHIPMGAQIEATVDGTPGANDMPGRLTFHTTSDGSDSPTERLRIDSNGNFIFKNGALIENGFHDDGGGLTGDYNHDLGTYGNVHFSATNAAGSFTYNLRINSSTTLNSVMAEGDVLSFTLMHASNNTARYMTQLKIDGSNVSPVWAGGSAPSAATGSGFDVYSFSIMKTGNNSYGIFGSFTNHA